MRNMFLTMWSNCSPRFQSTIQLNIINEIYVENQLPKLYSKLIFKRLLLNLTTENTFMLNSKFYKQVDGCSMGGPLSVIFPDIYLTKTERNIAERTKPQFSIATIQRSNTLLK